MKIIKKSISELREMEGNPRKISKEQEILTGKKAVKCAN